MQRQTIVKLHSSLAGANPVLIINQFGTKDTDRKILMNKIIKDFPFTAHDFYEFKGSGTNRELYTAQKYIPNSDIELPSVIRVKQFDDEYKIFEINGEEYIETDDETYEMGTFDTLEEALQEAKVLAERKDGLRISESGIPVTWEDIQGKEYDSLEEIYGEVSFAIRSKLDDIDFGIDAEEISDKSTIITMLADIKEFGEELDSFQLEAAIYFFSKILEKHESEPEEAD